MIYCNVTAPLKQYLTNIKVRLVRECSLLVKRLAVVDPLLVTTQLNGQRCLFNRKLTACIELDYDWLTSSIRDQSSCIIYIVLFQY